MTWHRSDAVQPEARNECRPLHISQQPHPRPRPTARLAGHVALSFATHLAEGQKPDVSGADCSAYFLQFFFLIADGLRADRVVSLTGIEASNRIIDEPVPDQDMP